MTFTFESPPFLIFASFEIPPRVNLFSFERDYDGREVFLWEVRKAERFMTI